MDSTLVAAAVTIIPLLRFFRNLFVFLIDVGRSGRRSGQVFFLFPPLRREAISRLP
ncbi:hypothetical protein [Streptomyces sp. NPDC012510]|uniref:hypothetical protein n=1 Tax=Streptomyces sp. NPDC012510 TaxID=3364838 RepID=UPI0036E4553F